MDYVAGTDLEKLLPLFIPIEKKAISKEIKHVIDELWCILAQGYFGNLVCTPYTDGVLSIPDDNLMISGPFES